MISVIIVTYNSRGAVERCLESLKSSGAEMVVVDNASTDGTADVVRKFPYAKLLPSQRNLGFAAAANLGARQSAGNALLFLNPDTVCRGRLDALEEALARSKNVAAVAPRLIDSHGQPQIGFNVRRLPTPLSLIFEILLLNRLFPSNPVNRRYRCLDLDPEQAAEVEQPAGACLLVRRSDFERCGGFDEGFFPLWFEDADLCFRLRQQGGAILYYPQVSFEHQGGHSVESLTFSEKQIYWYRNLLYYVYKHFPTGAGLAVRGALFWGVGFRMVADVLGLDRYRSRSDTARGERLRAYWNAAKLSLMDWRRLGSGL